MSDHRVHTTTNRRRRILGGAVLGAVSALIALGAPAAGHADPDPGPTAGPGMGCETIHWGAFGVERRKVCDGPIQPDGSWQRTRIIWRSAYYQPVSCVRNVDPDDPTSERRLTDCDGHWVDKSVENQETYPVTPDTVLPDEPGWLPPYTDNIF